MIFYFSGTGNSQWVAESLAKKIGDSTVDICTIQCTPSLDREQYVGFVFPVYAWGAAQPMSVFVRSLPKTSAFTYGICTCGADAGLTMKKLSEIFRLNSSYSIAMPSNYIIGDDIESENIIKSKLENAAIEIDTIAEEILCKKHVYRVSEGKLKWLKSKLINPAFNKFARSTKPFYADKKCTGCGICERECPAATINLINGTPSWGDECYQCLRCINCCPESAIQYGKKTESRGRYSIKKYI